MTASDTAAKGGKGKTLKTVIVVILSLAIAALVLLYLIFIRKPYTEPLDHLCNAIENADGNHLYACFNEDMISEYHNKDKKELKKDYKTMAKQFYDMYSKSYGYGDDFSLSYEIQRETRASERKLKDYQKLLDNFKADLEVDDGYTLKIKFIVETESEKSEEIIEFDVWKINDKWVMMYE